MLTKVCPFFLVQGGPATFHFSTMWSRQKYWASAQVGYVWGQCFKLIFALGLATLIPLDVFVAELSRRLCLL